MADPRRSARSTKGVNTRLSDINIELASPIPARRRKSTPKQPSPPQDETPSEDEENEEGKDDIIRCVCGATEEDEDDDRMMIQCEQCQAWQHTQCMGIPKKKIPKQYFCESCRPDQHELLLSLMAAGEKPWIKGGRRKKLPVKSKEATPAKPKEATPARNRRGTSTATDKGGRGKSPVKPPAVEASAAPTTPVGPKVEDTIVNAIVGRHAHMDMMDIDSAEAQVPNQQQSSPQPRLAPTEPQMFPVQPAPVLEDHSHLPPTVAQPIPMQSEAPTAHSQLPSPTDLPGNTIKQDGMDGDATIPQENMPSIPESAGEPKKHHALPPIDTDNPASRPRTRNEAMENITTPKTPRSAKRKGHDSDGEFKVDESKEQPNEKKQRRTSAVPATPEPTRTPKAPYMDRRRSSAAATKPPPSTKKAKEDTTPQKELVNSITELRNTNRVNVVTYLRQCLSDHAKRLVAEKHITLQPNSTVESLCENRALQIEHHMYLNHFAGGHIDEEYRKRSRSIGYNLKNNPSLSDEILGGKLSCERLTHMSTEEMASKELKELTQQVRLESEKHNTLINETGPRIRRTHKGEELVDEDLPEVSGQDTILESGTIIRRYSEAMDDLPSGSPARPDSSAQSPTLEATKTSTGPSSGLSRSPSQTLPADDSEPPKKENRSFSIENVWSHVETPDTERRPARVSVQPPPPPPMAKPESKIDKDIDMLLNDDQEIGTPPYSPASYNDAYSPREDQEDTVWRGRIDLNQIAQLNATASLLGGPESIGDKRWFELLDSVLNIDGRIKYERATEYLCGQKYSKSSSMILASLRPEHAANQQQFDKLFDYFKAKERYAVVGKHDQECIKDLYMVPIDADEPLPDWFGVVDPPSKVPATGRGSRMLVLIFVVIRSLVSGYIENGNGSTPFQQRFSANMQGITTPHQPEASPYAPSQPPLQQQHHSVHQQPQPQQYQAPRLSHQPPSRQQQQSPYSPSPVNQTPPQPTHFNNQHAPVTYGYGMQPQQQYAQQYGQPQQHPHPLPPLSRATPPQYQPQQHQPMAYVPTHPMTQELINIIPKLGEMQARAIDKLLMENPELQTKPDMLAKEVEKVLGS